MTTDWWKLFDFGGFPQAMSKKSVFFYCFLSRQIIIITSDKPFLFI